MARKPSKMPRRNKKNFRSTKSGAGMTEAGVKAYRRMNPEVPNLKQLSPAKSSPEVKRLSAVSLSVPEAQDK